MTIQINHLFILINDNNINRTHAVFMGRLEAVEDPRTNNRV